MEKYTKIHRLTYMNLCCDYLNRSYDMISYSTCNFKWIEIQHIKNIEPKEEMIEWNNVSISCAEK